MNLSKGKLNTLKPYPKMKGSGVIWLGDIPKHWNCLPGKACLVEKCEPNKGLKESTILSLSYGKIIVKSQDKLHGLVPESFETYQIIDPGEIILRPTDLQNDQTSFRFGFSRNRGIITSAYLCIKTKPLLKQEFGYLLLHSYDTKKVFYGLGSGLRQNLDWQDLKYLPCIVPPLPEQINIIRFLDYMDRKIKKYISDNQKLINLLEEQKQAIINDAVTGRIDVRTGKPYPKYKDSGINWLGMVPEHWEIVPLKRLVRSNIETLSENTDADFEFDYLEINNVKTGYILNNPMRIKFGDAPSRARRKVRKGDTIISTVRTYLKSVLFIDSDDCDNLIVSTGFSVLSPKKSINSRFLGFLLQSNNFINRVIMNSIGVSYPGIADSKLISLKIIQPHLNDQAPIVEYILEKTKSINLTISNLKSDLSLMQEFRIRLIADVVTGKLDVRDIANKLSIESDESEQMESFEKNIESESGMVDYENGQMEIEE